MAGATMGMGNHHDVVYTQFVDCHYQAAHSRIESRDYQSARILYNLGVAILQSQSNGEQLGKTGIHAREHGQFLVGIFIGKELLISFLCHETLVVCQYLINHIIKK